MPNNGSSVVMMSDDVKCEKCLAWELFKRDIGRCRKRAPIVAYSHSEEGFVTEWPTTIATDFCLEFIAYAHVEDDDPA